MRASSISRSLTAFLNLYRNKNSDVSNARCYLVAISLLNCHDLRSSAPSLLLLGGTTAIKVYKRSQHLSPLTDQPSSISIHPLIPSQPLIRTETLRLLKRMPYRIILPHPNLFLLLRHYMLHPNLLPVLRYEFPDIPRVPQLTGDAQVFTAAHQRVGFAALGRGGDGLRRKVVHLAARDGHESTNAVSVCI